jgi:ATP-dependent protease ClpP protease subunit
MHRLPSNLGALRAAWRNSADDVVSRETPCFRLVNADTDKPKLYVYDVIGGWDNDSGEFVRAVHGITADALDLHINSPGGFVYDGVAMFEALQESPARVDVHVDGLAASAASFLAMAGDTVEIAKAGRMMIHDAQGVGIGGPADLREFADLLDEVSNDIAGYYAERAGGTPAAWRKTMSATTWYSAAQAVDAKLADRVSGGKKQDDGPDNRTRLITARHRALTTLGG